VIVFENHCQLGNQMFIYAAARGLSKKALKSYCLNTLGDLNTYFLLTPEDRFFNNLKYLRFRIINKISKFNFYHLQDNFQDYSESLDGFALKNAWFYGYFQGEGYFSHCKNDIISAFTLKSKFIKKFNQKIKKLEFSKRLLVIHIRLKDYKTFGPDYLNGPDMTLPFQYYRNRIQEFDLNEYHVVFISDDIESVEKEFKDIQNAYFSNNDIITDFQFILNANALIISHSTFAWWGAWLNNIPEKIVIAPKFFLGFKINKDYPINILPSDWIAKSVYE
jgi:hypothetical protein